MPYIPWGSDVPQFFDSSGNPLESGYIEAFEAGTSTPTTLYADSSGTALGTTVTLNAAGRPQTGGGAITQIWLNDGISYKLKLRDSDGTLVWEHDDVFFGLGYGQADTIDDLPDGLPNKTVRTLLGAQTIGDGGGGVVRYDTSVDRSTHNGVTIFDPTHSVSAGSAGFWTPENTGGGCWVRTDTHLGINVLQASAVGDGATDDTAAIQAALDVGGVVYVPDGAYVISSMLTVSGRSSGGLMGNGSSSILVASAAMTAMLKVSSSSGFAIKDLVFWGDELAYANSAQYFRRHAMTAALWIEQNDLTHISDLSFHAVRGSGIKVARAIRSTFQNIEMSFCGDFAKNAFMFEGNSSLTNIATQGAYFSNIGMESCPNSAVFRNTDAGSGSDVTFTSNTMEGFRFENPSQQYLAFVGTHAFQDGETITGGTSGASATVLNQPGSTPSGYTVLRLEDEDTFSGQFQEGETITGGTSGASAALSTLVRFDNQLAIIDGFVGNDGRHRLSNWHVNRAGYATNPSVEIRASNNVMGNIRFAGAHAGGCIKFTGSYNVLDGMFCIGNADTSAVPAIIVSGCTRNHFSDIITRYYQFIDGSTGANNEITVVGGNNENSTDVAISIGSSCNRWNVSGVTISNMTSATGTAPILLDGAFCRLSDCIVYDASNVEAGIEDTGGDNSIVGCSVISIVDGADGDGHGIKIEGANRSGVQNCQIYAVDGNGIYVKNAAVDRVSGCDIRQYSVSASTFAGIRLESAAASALGMIVDGNKFDKGAATPQYDIHSDATWQYVQYVNNNARSGLRTSSLGGGTGEVSANNIDI